MENLLLWVGRLAGPAGFLVCLIAGVERLSGKWMLGGFQVFTILQLGMALLLLACLGYCASIAERARQ